MTFKIIEIAFQDIPRLDVKALENSVTYPRSIIVPASTPVEEIAGRIELEKSELVLCIEATRGIVGVAVPARVRAVIAGSYQMPVRSFAETIEFMIKSPQERLRNFRHERLNSRVFLYRCQQGPHYADSDPCPIHHIPTTPEEIG
jgi:hypothetical protein